MNNVKVFGLMALLTGLFAAVGGAIGGRGASRSPCCWPASIEARVQRLEALVRAA